MRIDWDVYKEVLIRFTNQDEIKQSINMMVTEYVLGENTRQIVLNELKHLGILIESNQVPTEERRNIVQPFNFMGDGTQNS